MSEPTFFPREVQVAICKLKLDMDAAPWQTVLRSTRALLVALKNWEIAWRKGEAFLVPQLPEKPNGEGGL